MTPDDRAELFTTLAEHATLLQANNLDYVLVPTFEKCWNKLRLTLKDLHELLDQIAVDPLRGPVVRGTNGVRKMRFAPSRLNRGKSGTYRVCYAIFVEHAIVVLMIAFSKGAQDSTTRAQEAAMREEIDEIRTLFRI